MTAVTARRAAINTPPPVATAPAAPAIPKTTVPTASLRQALAVAGKIAPARSSNPSFTRVLLYSSGQVLTLAALNTEMSWCARIPAPDLPKFVCAVNAARLAKLVRYLTEDATPLKLDEDEGELQIYVEQTATLYSLQADSVMDHPMLAAIIGLNTEAGKVLSVTNPLIQPTARTIPAAELGAAMKAVFHATSDSSFQSVFRGVCFSNPGDHHEIVASDGYRLAVYRVSRPLPAACIERSNAAMLIPLLLAQPSDEQVRVYAGEQAIRPDETAPPLPSEIYLGFGIHHFRLAGITGNYPDYRRVMSKEGVETQWRRTPLLARLRGLGIVGRATANHRMGLQQSGGVLSLAVDEDEAKAVSVLGLELDDAAPVTLSGDYNMTYLYDAIKAAPEENLHIQVDIKQYKLTIKAGSYTAVVIGLRT